MINQYPMVFAQWLVKMTRNLVNPRSLKADSFALMLLLFAGSAGAVPLLYDIRYNPLLSGETHFEFVFDEEIGTAPDIEIFNDPPRIELFFKGTDFEQNLARVMIEKSGVQSIQTVFDKKGTKVVVTLEHLKIYQGQLKGNVYNLQVTDNPVIQNNGEATENHQYINKIKALDFRRGDKGEGRILIFLEDNTAAVDIVEKDNKVVIEFVNTDLLPELLYQLDVMDFGTVVSSIETFKEDANTRVVVSTTGSFTYDHQQIDNIFTMSLAKASETNDILGSSKIYKGKPISLNFQDIPVRTVLQIIADYNDFNLVTSDSITGSITLRLDGTPWDQALDIVLKVKGLDKRMEGNILMVAPSEELAAREAKELQAKQQVEKLESLHTEFIQVNYAKATEIAQLLQSEGTSFISNRGAISVDQRTNTLLIKDTLKSIESVRKAIDTLDIPVRQVIIEARMVTVKDNVAEELGVRWGASDQETTDGYSGSLEGAQTISTGTIPPIGERLNVNLPVNGAAGSIAFHVAKLIDGTILDLELSALERENKGEIIASPRIMTANQKKARIEQGTEIPFVQASSSGATTVTFKKAVLSLEVTPHVTPDDRVILDLIITQDTRGDTVQTGNGAATAIDTQRIETQVLVENGETIVLGGIFQQQIVSAVSKVPLLGDIPYVGRMFRTDSILNEKTELLIFVTPKIVTNSF
jgi:type IV pilus assembly protein PilQ